MCNVFQGKLSVAPRFSAVEFNLHQNVITCVPHVIRLGVKITARLGRNFEENECLWISVSHTCRLRS
jgi:hypothetical protein